MAIDRKHVQHTMYDDMAFPDYEFREFPMSIPVVNGQIMPTPYDENHRPHPVVIVESQAELDALRGPEVVLVEVQPGQPGSPKRVENDDDLRAALYIQAEQAGVKIDKRWPTARIEDTLRAAAAAASDSNVV